MLSYYLDHLYRIEYPKHLINLYFIINNSRDNSEGILLDFKKQHEHEYNKITIDKFHNVNIPKDERTNEIRKKYTYNHLSNLRNKLFSIVDTDYLLSVDSDILVSCNILTKLLFHNKDIVAGLIYNGYLFNPTEPHKYPNILKHVGQNKYEHICNYYVKNAPNLTESKLVSVDATGAVVLMSKAVCQQTSYAYHDQGEDLAWSKDCQDKGFNLFCDASVFCRHCMNEELLQKFLKEESNIK